MVRQKGVIVLGVLLVIMSTRAYTAETVVAVFDMQDRTAMLEREVLEALTEYLSLKLAKGGFAVIPRFRIHQHLQGDKNGTYRDCFNQDCQKKVGQELSAQKMFSSMVTKVDGKCQLEVSQYDLKKAVVEKTLRIKTDCNEESLGQAVSEISAKLFGRTQAGLSDYLGAYRAKLKEIRRADKAWKVVQIFAHDSSEPLTSRIVGIKKFLAEFGDSNRHRAEAKAMIKGLSRLLPARLSIRTNPSGALVVLDGHKIGVSPVSGEIGAGKHKLIVSLDAYSTVSKTVRLTPGQQAEFTMELDRLGTLRVETDPPDALVVVSDKEIGTGNVHKDFDPGSYTLRVAAKNHLPQARKVVLVSGKVTDVKIVLESAPALSVWGHAVFWPGLGLAAFGAVSEIMASGAGNDYKAGDRTAYDQSVTWTAFMYAGLAGGVALMATGVVLWILAPSEDISTAPIISTFPTSEGGLVFSLSGRF